MQANSTDNRTFQLSEDEHILGELIYENMFMLKAQIKLNDSEIYLIKPVGFFGTSITVSKDDIEIVNLKMNWRGQIVFTFQDGQEFVLKAKGILANKFIVEDKDGAHLIQLDPKFNWRKFHYNYEITYEQRPKDIVFVLLSVYASNYFIATMSGAV